MDHIAQFRVVDPQDKKATFVVAILLTSFESILNCCLVFPTWVLE